MNALWPCHSSTPKSASKLSVMVYKVGDLVGAERTADAGMLRPAVHAGLEEGAVDDQLTASLEQVEQARFALGPVKGIGLFHRKPRHPPPLGGQRVTGAGQGLLLDEKLGVRGLPLLRRHNRWHVHGVLSFPALLGRGNPGHRDLRTRATLGVFGREREPF